MHSRLRLKKPFSVGRGITRQQTRMDPNHLHPHIMFPSSVWVVPSSRTTNTKRAIVHTAARGAALGPCACFLTRFLDRFTGSPRITQIISLTKGPTRACQVFRISSHPFSQPTTDPDDSPNQPHPCQRTHPSIGARSPTRRRLLQGLHTI